MNLKLICCNVFMREACAAIAQTPHVIDVEFTELGEHVHSETLRDGLQARIDAAGQAARRYDAILLLYGVCGNATIGLQARSIPLVIPRAHDCCTILLGSRAKFREHFEVNPSTPFSSAGYMERGDYYLRVEDGQHQMHFGDSYASYVEQYGEENARFIWESMHPVTPEGMEERAIFIEVPETAHLGAVEAFRAKVEGDHRTFIKLDGDLRLIRKLIGGEWDPEEFLVVPPGQKTQGVYDWSEILRAVPA